MHALKVTAPMTGAAVAGVRTAAGSSVSGLGCRALGGAQNRRSYRSREVTCLAGAGDEGSAPKETATSVESMAEPDNQFLIKLLGLSTGGALLIKYGSLLTDIPFTANASFALGMIYGPTLIYAISLALRPSEADG